MYHIIPDIHGQADKLTGLLDHLGWRRTPFGWRAPQLGLEIVFLGDFIDRGPENARSLAIVRSLIDAGKARAIMGNHEFNAIQFHTEIEGRPLRQRSEKNLRQHASFLREFPIGAAQTAEVIDWMQTLPLLLEDPAFRAVHACWHGPSVERLREELVEDRLTDAVLHHPGWATGPLYDALQNVTSGLEAPLPDGFSFHDKDGVERRHTRIAWWMAEARSWQQIARSVPDPDCLPTTPLPPELAAWRYRETCPVFFGHYWESGTPRVEAPHALCLDYSAGLDGPLLAYDFDPSEPEMSVARIRMA
ncbi:metallophosphoesterase [Tropicimonas sp. TH_r6]|uniref:metallophosphoesterase n=1 Tax=Tropicimonas sp. TH_r6 TaxID=3082085 RepID=UPI002954298C|nr:metallophosphoesterase [Tropicimonas sp. TH_r6]MDV7142958.1 metallophosphoesterase [Tropicimonas sp. TH_r6]